MNPEAVMRKVYKWIRPLERRRLRESKPVGFFALVAQHRNTSRCYINLLALGVGNSDPRAWERKWYFGRAEIEPYNREENGTFCLSKTLTSARILNYSFGGILKNAEVVKRMLKNDIKNDTTK